MKNLFFIPFLLLIACKEKLPAKSAPIAEEPIYHDIIREIYIDSISLGQKGKYKLELKKIENPDSIYADIHFFEKNDNKWIEKQHFTFEKDGVTNCYPEYKDFNNDGFNDFIYVSAIAARSANEVKKLFIFDPRRAVLLFIKNSEDYPNLQYNKELDCVDAFSVYGGSSSHFLKIEGDMLREFARIDLFNGYREIYRKDKSNKDFLIKRDTFGASYLRYKNFDPLEEYEDF